MVAVCSSATLLLASSIGFAAETKFSAEPITVAILPFQNATGDPEAAHWRYTLAEMTRTRLARLGAVRVRSREAVQFGVRQANLPAGEALNEPQVRQFGELIEARRVVWGSYRRDEAKWLLQARILNVANGTVIAELQVDGEHWPDIINGFVQQTVRELDIGISEEERQKLVRYETASAKALEWLSKAYQVEFEPGLYPQVGGFVREALAEDPQCALAHAIHAATLGTQGKFEAAEAALRESLKIDPEFASAHRILAKIAINRGEPAEANQALKDALRLEPAEAANFHALGEFHMVQRNYPEAIAACKRALELEPFSAQTRATLGYAFAQTGNRLAALVQLQEAERLAPEELNVLQQLCLAYVALKNLPAALERHEKFVPRARAAGGNPKLVDYFEEQAGKLRAMMIPHFVTAAKPKPYSRKVLETALRERLTPGERKLVINPLARTAKMEQWARELTRGATNDFEKAKHLFDALARRVDRGGGGSRTAQEVFRAWNDPEISFYCQEYARLYVALARAVGLDAFFVIVRRDVHGDPVLHACAGVFVKGKALLVDPSYNWFGVPHQEYVFLDTFETIVNCLNQQDDIARIRLAVKLQPDSALSQFYLAMTLIEQHSFNEARLVLKRALELEPESWLAFQAQGALALFEGRTVEAEQFLRQSLALNPKHDGSALMLARILHAANRLKEARDTYQIFLQLQGGRDTEDAQLARREIVKINEALAEGESKLANRASAPSPVWHLKAAERGDAQAQFTLGMHYFRGEGVEKSFAEAFKWLVLAASGKHEAAVPALKSLVGLMPFDEQIAAVGRVYTEYEKEVSQIEGLPPISNPSTQLLIGLAHGEGKGVPKDSQKAVEWYRRSAEQGNALAQCALGNAYFHGRGVQKDYLAAMKWYRQSAENGDATAAFKLGAMYREGIGTERDASESLKWLRMAAEQNDAEAQTAVALAYLEGKGVEKDGTEAMRWLQKAAEAGQVQAQYVFGGALAFGEMVSKDRVEAYKWLHLAAEKGEPRAGKLREEIALEMSAAEVADGIRRAVRHGQANPGAP